MKAILIDPAAKSIEYIERESFPLPEVHRLVQTEVLDFAYPFGRYEYLSVADDGRARQLPMFFIEGYTWPIYGRALLLGLTMDRMDHSTRCSIERIHSLIVFP